jgi:dTDP-4-dehydrorhamnose reductase
MALLVCRRFGLDGTVVPISTAELGQSARRPLRSGLKTDLVQSRFQIRPRSFDDGLNILAEQVEDINPHGLKKVPGR